MGRGEGTEEATPRRLAEARRRGEVAISRELSSAAALAAAVLVLTWDAPAAVSRTVAGLRVALSGAVAAHGVSDGWAVATAIAPRLIAPALGAVLLATLAVGLAQTGGLVAPVRVDLGRVASAGAWWRLVDGRAALGVIGGLLKVALVGAVAVVVLRPLVGVVVSLTGAGPPRLLAVMGALAGRLAVRLSLAMLALGIADLLWVRRRHLRSLRMTREEVKRDFKEAEGDPAHRGERQRLHRELLEQRLLEEVRRADFVVVNPEHIAVALRYDADGDAAPVVVAKGERLVAERIKQIAREAGVPIFRDVGLARALAELAEGGEIPAALYEAVAEILRVVQGQQEPSPASDGDGAVGPATTAGRGGAIGPGAGWKRV
jgi:flagellar biosynthesis protein FlhB